MSKLFRKSIINSLLSMFMLIIIIRRSFSSKFDLHTVQMIRNHGYKSAQIYKFQTTDGYKIELHRIPRSREGKKPFRKYPVLIPNIYLGSSADWVIGGPTKSLPEQLADSGYDVWLGNYRGNTYCREHASLDNKDYEFWDFSLHELGETDLPETIDYILTQTHKTKLHYIAFSMSTTTFMIMASLKPHYMTKIQTNIMMAPVANIFHTTSSFRYIASVAKTMNILFRVANHGEIFSYKRKVGNFFRKLCNMKYLKDLICLRLALWTSCGKDPYYFDESLIPYIFGHYPAGTSSKLIQHYSQSIMSDGFYQYDYGPKKNLDHYKSRDPPPYDLNQVKAPTFIFYADNDLLANPRDTVSLEKQLPNVVDFIKVNNSFFNHADFIFGTEATELIYNPIKDILRRYDIPSYVDDINESVDDTSAIVDDKPIKSSRYMKSIDEVKTRKRLK